MNIELTDEEKEIAYRYKKEYNMSKLGRVYFISSGITMILMLCLLVRVDHVNYYTFFVFGLASISFLFSLYMKDKIEKVYGLISEEIFKSLKERMTFEREVSVKYRGRYLFIKEKPINQRIKL